MVKPSSKSLGKGKHIWVQLGDETSPPISQLVEMVKWNPRIIGQYKGQKWAFVEGKCEQDEIIKDLTEISNHRPLYLEVEEDRDESIGRKM